MSIIPTQSLYSSVRNDYYIDLTQHLQFTVTQISTHTWSEFRNCFDQFNVLHRQITTVYAFYSNECMKMIFFRVLLCTYCPYLL